MAQEKEQSIKRSVRFIKQGRILNLKATVAQSGTAQTISMGVRLEHFWVLSRLEEILFPKGYPGSNPGGGVLF